MKKKEENLTYEEYVRLRETRRLGETKEIIKQRNEVKETEELEVIKKNETLIAQTLKVAKVLKDNGVNLRKLKISKKGMYLLLGEIEQDGIDMEKIIEENGLEKLFKFGEGISRIRTAYKGKGTYKITEEEKREVEKLELAEAEKGESEISKTLKIVKILNDEGVNFGKVQLIKNSKFVLLEEIEQDGVDIQEIMKKYKLDGKLEIGKKIQYLKNSYKGTQNYKMTYEEKKKTEEMRLVGRETSIAETLRIAKILNESGVDLTKIRLTKMVDKKQEYTVLRDIKQDGIDMQKIIEENGLDGDFKIGNRVVNLRTEYNNLNSSRIAQDEREEAEKIGLIAQGLKKRVEQKKMAIDERRKAKELYDRWMKSDRERRVV